MKPHILPALAALLVAFPFSAVVLAAETYKKGEEIEVFFLNKWWPGTVADTNKRGDVLGEFEFAGTTKREVFTQANVRFKYESGAIYRGRLWSDASGKFKVKAALLSIDGDQIKIRKQEDLAEIDIPIQKLCDSDKQFLKTLQKEKGPVAALGPASPQLQKFEETQKSAGQAGDPTTTYQPDPVPVFKKLKQGGVGFVREGFFDRLGAVLPVGGAESWVLAAIEDETPGEAKPTRLLWASLVAQKINGRQLLPPRELLLDYHPRSHRLLTFSSLRTKDDPWGSPTLTLWEVVPTDTSVKPIVRWDIDFGTWKNDHYAPWARLVDGNVVVHRLADHEFVVWNAEQKQMIYRTKQESFFAPDAVMSGGGKYLFLPEDKGVRILECTSGQLVGILPVTDGASGVALSEDGRRAAVLGRSTLSVFDLLDLAAAPKTYRAEAIGTPFSATLSWVGEDRLMARTHWGHTLFSLKHGLALWNYEFDHEANPSFQFQSRRICEVIDSHLLYTASVRIPQDMLAVGAVKLPGPKVDDVAGGLDPEKFLLIKPGSEVRLDVRCGTDTQRVQDALQKKAEANGWKVSPSASTLLIAEMRRGEARTTTYESRSAPSQTVTITPYISELKLMIGDKTAWQGASSSGAPPFLRLPAGASVQAEVDKWQLPNPGFFEQVAVPARIMDPAKRGGFGTTQVTTKGLVPKS
jgi:hypothetical protein